MYGKKRRISHFEEDKKKKNTLIGSVLGPFSLNTPLGEGNGKISYATKGGWDPLKGKNKNRRKTPSDEKKAGRREAYCFPWRGSTFLRGGFRLQKKYRRRGKLPFNRR